MPRLAVRPTLEWSNAGPSLSLYSGSRDFRDQLGVVAVAGPVDPLRHWPAQRNHLSFQPITDVGYESRAAAAGQLMAQPVYLQLRK